MPRNRVPSRYAQQALDEAELKFGPQASALSQLLGSLKAERNSELKSSRSASRMASESARRALPQVEKIYTDAAGQTTGVESMLAKDLQNASDAYKLAFKVGTSGTNARRVQAGALAQQEAASRQADAITGGVQEQRAIRSKYRDDSAKVGQELRGLAGQSGLYASTRVGQLLDDARERNVKIRGQNLTAREKARDRRADARNADRKYELDVAKARGVDPVTGAKLPGKGKSGGGGASKVKWVPPATQASAQDQIAQAISHAREMRKAGRSRSEIATILVQGRGATSVEDDKGNKIPVKARPKLPQLYVTAGLDMAFGGGLHPVTIRKLQDRKFKVKPLGLPTYKPRPAPRGGAERFAGQRATGRARAR